MKQAKGNLREEWRTIFVIELKVVGKVNEMKYKDEERDKRMKKENWNNICVRDCCLPSFSQWIRLDGLV